MMPPEPQNRPERPGGRLADDQTPAESPLQCHGIAAVIAGELRAHAPFTMLGTLTGVLIMAGILVFAVPRSVSTGLFWTLHPIHVLLSAMVTTAMFTLHSRRRWATTLAIGYLGSVGIATLSDCIIPYLGESLLDLPHRGIHLGFLEKWWLVNPLAVVGILLGASWPHTKLFHAGHVLLSTWASLFHMTMAFGEAFDVTAFVSTAIVLFFAVWIPCCTSDIVFPLLFSNQDSHAK
jgi:hypothetical protein